MDKEKIMQQWDYHRSRIAEDNWGGASEPRDWFESIIDWMYALEAENERLQKILDNQLSDDELIAKGMEHAAEIADNYHTKGLSMAIGKQIAKNIRAKIKGN